MGYNCFVPNSKTDYRSNKENESEAKIPLFRSIFMPKRKMDLSNSLRKLKR